MTKAWCAVLLVVLVPMTAAAQTTQTTQGPLVLERLHNPFVVAPDYKITDIDGDTGQLAGAYAGRLLADTLFVGGGFYWLVNGDHGEEMRYGGLILGWSMPAGRAVRFGARGLVGVGTATLGVESQFIAQPRGRNNIRGFPGQTVRFLARDDFFVFEPQVNATVQVIPHVGVEVGGGYRVSGATGVLEDRLNGVSGNVGVQLTW
jgi:hypothetical protein